MHQRWLTKLILGLVYDSSHHSNHYHLVLPVATLTILISGWIKMRCAPQHCYNCEPSSVHQEPEEWVQLSPGRPRDGTCVVCDFFGYLILMILVILVIVVILMVRRMILRGKRIARGPAASPGVVIARARSVHLWFFFQVKDKEEEWVKESLEWEKDKHV